MPTKHGFTEKCYGCKYLSLCGHGYACTNEYYCNNADKKEITMTDKEKARAYDEALEKTKQIIMDYDYDEHDNVFMEIFPELRESKDEMVKNCISMILTDANETRFNDFHTTLADCLDWLEKNYNVDNANKEYWRGYREGKQEILDKYTELEKQGRKELNKIPIWKHWKDGICGNGEGLPIYLIRDGNTYSLSSCLGFECDYIELSELDNLMLEKQDWSEEDENKIDTIIQIYHPSKKIMDWLKSLKDRVQPKQKHDEWNHTLIKN